MSKVKKLLVTGLFFAACTYMERQLVTKSLTAPFPIRALIGLSMALFRISKYGKGVKNSINHCGIFTKHVTYFTIFFAAVH